MNLYLYAIHIYCLAREHKPTAFIGMPVTTKNKLNNVQEEFEAALKARKEPLAKHTWMIWVRYVGRILDTRFEVTRSKLNSVSFDMEMEINLHDWGSGSTILFWRKYSGQD